MDLLGEKQSATDGYVTITKTPIPAPETIHVM